MDTVENVGTTKKVGRPAKKSVSKEETDLEKLQKQVATLLAKVESMSSGAVQEVLKEESNEEEDEYVKVICMVDNELNLSTELKGRGNLFTFDGFGDVIKILYSDLYNIVRNHKRFAKEGKFLILNKRVVRKLGLDSAYESILDKDKIEKILSGNQSDAVNLFKTANKGQQETICQMIIKNGINGKKYDLNLLDRLSRVYKEDPEEDYSLSDKIKEGKEDKEYFKSIDRSKIRIN